MTTQLNLQIDFDEDSYGSFFEIVAFFVVFI